MGLLSEGALEVVDKSRQVNVFIDPQKAINNVRIFGLHFNLQENCFQYSFLYDSHFRCYETSYCNPKSLPKKHAWDEKILECLSFCYGSSGESKGLLRIHQPFTKKEKSSENFINPQKKIINKIHWLLRLVPLINNIALVSKF